MYNNASAVLGLGTLLLSWGAKSFAQHGVMRGAHCVRLGCATFSPPLHYGENVAYAGNVR